MKRASRLEDILAPLLTAQGYSKTHNGYYDHKRNLVQYQKNHIRIRIIDTLDRTEINILRDPGSSIPFNQHAITYAPEWGYDEKHMMSEIERMASRPAYTEREYYEHYHGAGSYDKYLQVAADFERMTAEFNNKMGSNPEFAADMEQRMSDIEAEYERMVFTGRI